MQAVLHSGIAGRTLSSSNPRRSVFPRQTQVDESQAEIIEETGKLRENIVADVRRITEPLFMLFDFMKFEDRVYDDIVTSFAKVEADRDLYSGLIRLHVLHHAAQGPVFGLA